MSKRGKYRVLGRRGTRTKEKEIYMKGKLGKQMVLYKGEINLIEKDE